jgi:hypothetical protein
MVSEAGSLSRTLRLCCPPWAWSMRDGMGHMQADVVAIKALQCSAEALTGRLKGDTGTLQDLSLVAAADTCYGSCDAPDGQSVRPSVSSLSRVSMEVAWHSGCSSPA